MEVKKYLWIFCLISLYFSPIFASTQKRMADRDGSKMPTPPTELNGKSPTLLGSIKPSVQAFSSPNPKTPPHTLISDDISIMSSSGGLLTLWSLQPNQWVWGYTPFDSIQLGDARIWKIITYGNGKIQIKNKKTGTCLSTFGNGVVHIPCNENDSYQLWTIDLYENQAIQLKNDKKGTCLQTPSFRYTTYYTIYTTPCSTPTQPNLDQQWYFTAPAIPADNIFTLNSRD